MAKKQPCKYCLQNDRYVSPRGRRQVYCKDCKKVHSSYVWYMMVTPLEDRLAQWEYYLDYLCNQEKIEQCRFCLEDWKPYEFGKQHKGACPACRDIQHNWTSLQRRRGISIEPRDYWLYVDSGFKYIPEGMLGIPPKCPYCLQARVRIHNHNLKFNESCDDCYILAGEYGRYKKFHPDESKHDFYLYREPRIRESGRSLAEASDAKRYRERNRLAIAREKKIMGTDPAVLALEKKSLMSVYAEAPKDWGLATFLSKFPKAGKEARHYLALGKSS